MQRADKEASQIKYLRFKSTTTQKTDLIISHHEKTQKRCSKTITRSESTFTFFMAYKTISPLYKEKSKRINRLWDLVGVGKLTNDEYAGEVEKMLKSYGGYSEVVEKTVKYYIEKTGEWTLQGDDKYCQDAKIVAETLLKK